MVPKEVPVKRSIALLLTCLTATCACSESARIRSLPEGAAVIIDGEHVGDTPTAFYVPRSQLKDSYNLKLVKEGYEDYVGDFPARIAAGRMVGAFFTLGIVYIFKSPRYLAVPRLITLQPSLEAEHKALQAEADRRLGEQLRDVERRRQEGELPADEADRQKQEIIERHGTP